MTAGIGHMYYEIRALDESVDAFQVWFGNAQEPGVIFEYAVQFVFCDRKALYVHRVDGVTLGTLPRIEDLGTQIRRRDLTTYLL